MRIGFDASIVELGTYFDIVLMGDGGEGFVGIDFGVFVHPDHAVVGFAFGEDIHVAGDEHADASSGEGLIVCGHGRKRKAILIGFEQLGGGTNEPVFDDEGANLTSGK